MASQDIRNAIEAADREFEATFARGDASGLADLYTAEGAVLPPGSEVLRGKDAVRQVWQGAMDMGIKEAELEPFEVEGFGDTAHEVGRYRLKGEGGQVMDRGKYIVIWKREGGRWKIHRDIFNSSMEPQS